MGWQLPTPDRQAALKGLVNIGQSVGVLGTPHPQSFVLCTVHGSYPQGA